MACSSIVILTLPGGTTPCAAKNGAARNHLLMKVLRRLLPLRRTIYHHLRWWSTLLHQGLLEALGSITRSWPPLPADRGKHSGAPGKLGRARGHRAGTAAVGLERKRDDSRSAPGGAADW